MKKKNNKIGILSDLHLTDSLPYSEYIKGGRQEEEKEVLNFIVKSFADTDTIIIGGDVFDRKNNSSSVIKKFTEFLEKFNDKKVYIISGNHEKKPDGTTALDYLKEIKNKNWKIITNKIETIKDIDFCPYFSKSELGVNTNRQGQKEIMKRLKGNKILVVHHALSASVTTSGRNTNLFDEIVLPRNELQKKYEIVIGAHIHQHNQKNSILITGSIFTRTVGEIKKYIWKINTKNFEIEKIQLPCREIHKLENPNKNDFKKIPKSSIVKVIIDNPKIKKDVPELKKELEKFDAHILIENYPRKRIKAHYEKGFLDLSIEELLKEYSKKTKISLPKLMLAWNLIKS